MTAFIPPMPKGPSKWLRMSDLKKRPERSVTFRFVTDIVAGLEKWTAQNKPVRVAYGEPFPAGVEWRKDDKGEEEDFKHFRAAGVYNMDDDCVQVFSWTQRKFNERLSAKLAKKKDPKAIAVTVTALDVTPADYDVDVEAAEPLTKEQKAKVDAVLETWTGPVALIGGGDPFAPFGEDVKPKDEVPF